MSAAGTLYSNPRISVVLRAVTWLEVAILAWAGLGLLAYPPLVTSVWPWSLAPFNTRYLGALYAAAFITALLQAGTGRWSPARVVTPMIFVFTLIVTVFSFVHFNRFDVNRVETWIWFVLYVGVCVNAGVHLWLYRRWRSPNPEQPTGAAPLLLGAQVGALGAYGIALLVAPGPASQFWPWRLDTFHAQLYSVTFITPALGAWVLLRGGDRLEWLTLGATQAGWGLLPIVGLLVVDSSIRRVPWSAIGTWVWIALFAAMAALGVWMMIRARTMSEWR